MLVKPGSQIYIRVKSQEKVHLHDGKKFTNQPFNQETKKISEPINLKSTRVIQKVFQSISCALQQVQPWGWTDLANRVKMPGSKKTRITFMGIILGCCTENANLCFQIPRFWVKKLKLTNRRKLSKMLLFMNIGELWWGFRVSGIAKFHFPGIGGL